MYSIGVKSLPLTSTVGFSVGLVFAMQTVGTLKTYGAVNQLATLVGKAILRELGPVLTALMVASRAGSGISAELGSMKVTRQIDALEVSAINPFKYLVMTRVAACVLVVPMLAVIADVLGVLGGWIIGVTDAGLGAGFYWSTTLHYITLADVYPGLLKTVFFGFLIGIISSFHGFNARGGTEGVGEATTTTVVVCCLSIMLSDVLLTKIFIRLFG